MRACFKGTDEDLKAKDGMKGRTYKESMVVVTMRGR